MNYCCKRKFPDYCAKCQDPNATQFRLTLGLDAIPQCEFPTPPPEPTPPIINGIRQVFYFRNMPYTYSSTADGIHIYHSSTSNPSTLLYCFHSNGTQRNGFWYQGDGTEIPIGEVKW